MKSKFRLNKNKIFLYIYVLLFLLNVFILFYLGSFIKEKVMRPINITQEEISEKASIYFNDIKTKDFDKIINNIEEKKRNKGLSINNFFN